MSNRLQTIKDGAILAHFAKQESLSDQQVERFKQFSALLLAWNKKINLTNLTSMQSIILYHFQDSLQLSKAIDVKQIDFCADVGSGGGFPGIPLALVYHHLHVTLIEVNKKKVQFLNEVIRQLSLRDRVVVYDQDWRTFLRTTDAEIQLFCARASLKPEELIRLFKPSCPYRNARLVYWASQQWEPSTKVMPYITDDVSYIVGTKTRRLIVMQQPA